MKIKEKIMGGRPELEQFGPINIVVFGDSISHGAVTGSEINYETVYWNRLKQKLNNFRNYIPVNVINASIGGTSAYHSLPRMESQVLKHEPDLVIVCFGLNDVNGELETYIDSLREIFTKCSEISDVIFMTPNMLNTYVADDIDDRTPSHLAYAEKTAGMQNSGRMDMFMDAAISLANEMGITVCDCYKKWKKLSETEDTTLLLANRINHPIREMHELFAQSLYEIIMNDAEKTETTESTMFRGENVH